MLEHLFGPKGRRTDNDHDIFAVVPLPSYNYKSPYCTVSVWNLLKVGLTRFHPTSRDKSDKMRDKQKVLNNFPTTLFIKNWLSSKCI